jgi:DNA recombination protein Rad52
MITARQQEILLKGINGDRIAQRKGGGGRSLSYLEAWDVKAHMNRIFGFLNWSADVSTAELAYEDNSDGRWNVAYKVILTLRVNGASYTEAAVGSATLPSRGEAHDMAIKTAESDAFKRAAINLGDQFGLSLYNNGSTAQ